MSTRTILWSLAIAAALCGAARADGPSVGDMTADIESGQQQDLINRVESDPDLAVNFFVQDVGGGFPLTQVLQNLRSDDDPNYDPLLGALAAAYGTGRLDKDFTIGVLEASALHSGKWPGSNNSHDHLDAFYAKLAGDRKAGSGFIRSLAGVHDDVLDLLGPDDSTRDSLNAVIESDAGAGDDAATRAAVDILLASKDAGKRARFKAAVLAIIQDYIGSFAGADLPPSKYWDDKLRLDGDKAVGLMHVAMDVGFLAGVDGFGDGGAQATENAVRIAGALYGWAGRTMPDPGDAVSFVEWSKGLGNALGAANAGLQEQHLQIGNDLGRVAVVAARVQEVAGAVGLVGSAAKLVMLARAADVAVAGAGTDAAAADGARLTWAVDQNADNYAASAATRASADAGAKAAAEGMLKAQKEMQKFGLSQVKGHVGSFVFDPFLQAALDIPQGARGAVLSDSNGVLNAWLANVSRLATKNYGAKVADGQGFLLGTDQISLEFISYLAAVLKANGG